jgi:hypothetical protein
VALVEESFTGQYLLRVLPTERVKAARLEAGRNGTAKAKIASKSVVGGANGRAKARVPARKASKPVAASKNGRPKAKAAARGR